MLMSKFCSVYILLKQKSFEMHTLMVLKTNTPRTQCAHQLACKNKRRGCREGAFGETEAMVLFEYQALPHSGLV